MRIFLNKRYPFYKRNAVRKVIRNTTNISCDHLTPEIRLHLITPECTLWNENPQNSLLYKVLPDPFWAFYWAGGQALTRYILDHPNLFKNKDVLDIGSGCGACSLAAKHCGAKCVVANDIDAVACEAIAMNSLLNKKLIHIYCNNLIGCDLPFKTDIIVVGDMFYSPDFSELLFNWLQMCRKSRIKILIGDPGRHALRMSERDKLIFLQEYKLLPHNALENNGFCTSCVWEL